MAGRECYHCKQWIEEGQAHDCWTTTEDALTKDLSEDLREAWERIRETATGFGDQRIYASLNSIMFSRRSCYFFVRPKKTYLEVCVFLGRAVTAPQVRRVEPASRTKNVHFLRISHRDEVEPPITDWLREAYDFAGLPPVKTVKATAAATTRATPKGKSKSAKTKSGPKKSATRKSAKKASAANAAGANIAKARKKR